MGIGNRINEIGAEGDGKPSSGDPTTWPGYKKEEVKDKNNTYDTTGGLPATLRYPNTALDDSMDFLVIRISDFVPAGLNLSGLVTVDKNDTKIITSIFTNYFRIKKITNSNKKCT